MTVTLSTAAYRELSGRDSMERASLWQGNAGTAFGLNCVYAACGAARGTTAQKAKTVSNAQFTVGGKIFTKAATDDFWTLSGTVVAAASFQKYLLCVDDAGVASIVEGTQSTVSAAAVSWGNIVAAAKANPANPWAAIMSVLNASRAIFAVLTVATNASTTFTPGTTALNAAGITATFNDGIDPTLFPLMANERGQIVGLQI